MLEVGRRLGKMLETRLGAEVVYTRKNDTFIPLKLVRRSPTSSVQIYLSRFTRIQAAILTHAVWKLTT